MRSNNLVRAAALVLFGGCHTPAAVAGSPTIFADLIVVNADVYTADPAHGRISAFAVHQGRFLVVGGSAAVSALTGPATRIIDAGGRTVLPGFIDGHSHMGGNAPRVAGVDLSYVVDKAEWLRLIAEADQRLEPNEWLTGGYWDHTLSDGKYPDREMLDEVVPERPVFLTHIDGHYGWANSRALRLAGIEADTPVPPGGEVLVDPTTRQPTGILLEGAMELVQRIIPERDATRRRAGLAAMQQYANSLGITGLHQMGDLDDYLHLVETGEPRLRIWYGMFGPEGHGSRFDTGLAALLEKREDLDRRVSASKKTSTLGPLLAIGYVKLMNDGVLSARTAVLLEDYHDRDGWRGEYITSPEDLKHKVGRINATGLPVAIHSIGDAAVRASLDAFESASGHPLGLPNRIEHIEVVEPIDVERFRALGVAASMQPNHCTNAIGYVPARLGPRRETHAYVWRDLLDAGVPLVFGADYPTSPLDPLTQIADAMFRQSPFGYHGGKAWQVQQVLSFEEALRAYTQASAEMTAWSGEIGSISAGKWADFVVLDGRVPEPMDEGFRKLKVVQTFFAGREVYQAPTAAAALTP